MEERVTLFMCLGLERPAAGGGALFWHGRMIQGLPYRSLEVLARYLRVKPRVVAAFIGMSREEVAEARKRRALPMAYSVQLFSIARLYRQALDVFRDEVKAAEWMGTPRPELRNHLPVDLARTPLGAETASVFLQRLRAQSAPTQEPVAEEDVHGDVEDTEADS